MTHQASLYLLDKRSQKSWHKIRLAFEELVLSKRYDEISVSEIIRNAGVARSTFYGHFNNKEAILAKSLSPPLSILADCTNEDSSIERLSQILQHFWEHRGFCRLILTGIPRKSVTNMLVELLEQKIIKNLVESGNQLIISYRHAAIQISGSQLAPLDAWLLGKAKSTEDNLALAMKKTSISLLNALVADEI